MEQWKVHHIAYLVKKIKRSIEHLEILGWKVASECFHDEIRKVDILFLEKEQHRIELVSPYSEESVVAHLMKTFRNAPYHICYEVPNLELAYQRLEEKGFLRIDEPKEAIAFSGRRVGFWMSNGIGMVELLEDT